MINRKRILFEDKDNGPEWVVVYHLGYDEIDDNMDDTDTTEIVLNAFDFETAVKYAQQYMRKMQSEEETSEEWANAQILSRYVTEHRLRRQLTNPQLTLMHESVGIEQD